MSCRIMRPATLLALVGLTLGACGPGIHTASCGTVVMFAGSAVGSATDTITGTACTSHVYLSMADSVMPDPTPTPTPRFDSVMVDPTPTATDEGDEMVCTTVVLLDGTTLGTATDTVPGTVCYSRVYLSVTSEDGEATTSLDSVAHDPTPGN